MTRWKVGVSIFFNSSAADAVMEILFITRWRKKGEKTEPMREQSRGNSSHLRWSKNQDDRSFSRLINTNCRAERATAIKDIYDFLFRERSPDNEGGTLPSAPTQYQHVDTSHVPLRREAIAIAEVRNQNHDQGLSLPLHFSDQNNSRYIYLYGLYSAKHQFRDTNILQVVRLDPSYTWSRCCWYNTLEIEPNKTSSAAMAPTL